VTSSHDFDAAVIAKDEHGKVKIVKKYEQPTRHGAAVGLSWGLAVGVTSLRFPPVGISLAAGTGDQVAANIKAANRVISRATDMAADQLATDMKQADADAAMAAGPQAARSPEAATTVTTTGGWLPDDCAGVTGGRGHSGDLPGIERKRGAPSWTSLARHGCPVTGASPAPPGHPRKTELHSPDRRVRVPRR
jgi:hypothetical protein